MTNSFNDQIIQDSNKKTVIRCIGILDGSGNESANVKIVGQNLMGALAVDSNNAITVAMGGTYRTNYRYSVNRITYDVNLPNPGYVRLDWSGANAVAPIWLCSGKFDMNFQENLGPIMNTANGPTGNILFTTVGAPTAQSYYCITLELHKTASSSGCDYDQGQIGSGGRQGRPNDFNFGTYSIKP